MALAFFNLVFAKSGDICIALFLRKFSSDEEKEGKNIEAENNRSLEHQVEKPCGARLFGALYI